MRIPCLCFVIAALAGLAFAAEPSSAPTSRPAASRRGGPPPIVSPDIQPDRTVIFRLRAPNATKVTVSGEWADGETPMVKDDEGVWSVAVGPVEPDIYEYGFSVDGLHIPDPASSAVKPARSTTTSILDVPGDPPLLHEFSAVPHGTVRAHWYQSQSLGKRRSLHVYTPPDYDRNADARYPVLYLFHGSGDSDATWVDLGRAHLILDNLIAAGKAKPMVIVMTDGHASFAQPASREGGRRGGMDAFQRDLLEDVMPFVEANYRVQTTPQGRAIVGVSMGGGQSLTIGLNHPELFAWVGGFSSAVYQPENSLAKALADAKATNDAYRLIWIACGKDDRLVQGSRDIAALLKDKGINHELVVSEGNHSYLVWRRYLAQFAPLLFQEK